MNVTRQSVLRMPANPRGVLASVATNVSVMMVGQAVTFTLTFVLRAALGRYLGDVGFGKLTFALSIAAIYAMVAGLGLAPLVTKEAARARHRAGEYLADGLLLRLIVGLLLYGVFCLAVSLLKDDPETRNLSYLVGLSLLIGSLTTMVGSVFQAFEKMVYASAGIIVEKVIVTGLAIGLLAAGHGMLAVGWVMVVGSAVHLAVSWLFLRRLGSLRFAAGLRSARTLLIASMPFFVWAIFTTIYARIDATMLSLMTNDAVTGWYGVSFAFYETLSFLPAMLKTTLFPVMSRLYVSDGEHFRLTFRESFYFFSLITPPMAFGVFALAEPIIGLIYPLDQFANAVVVTRILALGIIPLFYNILLATALLAVDKQRYWSFAAIACAFINPALNYYLIPYYQISEGNGGIGAAWATNLVEVFLLAAAVLLLPRGLIRARELSLALRALAAGAVMLAVVWWQVDLPLPLALTLGVAVYVALCVVLGIARLGELRRLLSLIRARHSDVAVTNTHGD